MLIRLEDLPLVAMEFMNTTHIEDINIINDIFDLILEYEKTPTEQNEEILNQKYKEWIEHTISHFKTEEIQMEQKQFPPYQMHKSEHDNALRLMNDIFSSWLESKDIQILKQYFVETLPSWLVLHIKTMDTVTAMFLKTGLSPCARR
jgi:hemerythrin